MKRPMHRKSLVVIGAIAAFVSAAAAQPAPPDNKPDVTLGSTPDTVVWGYISSRTPPVLRVKSGTTVRIDYHVASGPHDQCRSGHLFRPCRHQARRGAAGCQRHATPRCRAERRLERARAHRPRSMSRAPNAVRMRSKSACSISNSACRTASTTPAPARASCPIWCRRPRPRVIKTDLQRRVAFLPGGIELPLGPFLGIMAVAPPPDLIVASSGPPNKWAGNLDLKVLGVGSTLYIPVFNEGALFFTGDPHGVQGDGEVDGGALEQSLTGTLQFILHKGAGKAMRWPRAEDATNYYTLGLDVDLNVAMKNAVREAVELLQEKASVTAAEAYAIASMGVDFRVAEAVDSVQLIYAIVPKKFFKQNPAYWGVEVTAARGAGTGAD